jgi:hypothetical protein
MENKEGYIEFITSESYKHQIDIWHKAYNINREKIELFYDFIMSLYELVDETYLGSDVIKNEEEQKSHFTWCWDKIVGDFSKENISFKERGPHFEYFWNFFLDAFYMKDLSGDKIRIPEYIEKLFNFKHRKSRSELEILSELYKLLNLNLKK